jgi:TIR domain-containing protein
MPYLPQFQCDFFVSYGHLDNDGPSETEQRWISRFDADLERRVSQYLGTKITAWRDNQLAGNTDFPEEIQRKLAGAAVWIPILSPRFLTSDWCQRELGIFLQSVEQTGGIKIGTKTRIFKVVKTMFDQAEQPEKIRQVMKDLLGYEFYRLDENNRPREFPDLDPAPDAEKRYLAKLDDLAYDLHLLLKELKKKDLLDFRKDLGSPPVPSARSIYLAETTRDLSDSRDQIRRELLAQGYEVLPDRPLPLEVKELTSFVSSQLASCRLSLHLIGGHFGVVPENEEKRSVVWLQQELAAQRRASGSFHCLLWLPPGTDVAEGRQKQYLEHLQEQLRGRNDFELLKTPLEGLKNYIFDKLAERPQPPPRVEKRTRIYLICEARDFEAIRPIKDFLTNHQFGVDLPLQEGDQTEIRQDHEATLQDCDGVLLYHGAGSEAWLREKIRDLRRARGLGRQRPFLPQAIYIGPELTENKTGYSNDEFTIIREFGSFSPDSMQPLLSVRDDSTGSSQNQEPLSGAAAV